MPSMSKQNIPLSRNKIIIGIAIGSTGSKIKDHTSEHDCTGSQFWVLLGWIALFF